MQPVFTASPTSMRPALPDRNVDRDSIEDAYVAFILCCNPAVPLDADTTALREAFRNPPKSGGKSFSTFTLFELIRKLETKELKTWAELALRLGVEPPDQEKGQSSQKIQQYAVRLKRWMRSMHVDAFFEYLIGRQSSYWTDIPSEHTPITELERDGVPAEDDMAVRALLPHIRPRWGKRKPREDEAGKSPQQRPSPQPAGPDGGAGRQQGMEPWTAQPDGRGSVFLYPPVPGPSRSNPDSGPSWGPSDIAQTPLTAYPAPQSAVTPSTGSAFWADEPRSAITPSKPRSASKRHGAKAVSSAWRRGEMGGSGKTRGRPPMNRGGNVDGPFSAFPTSEGPAFRFPSPTPDKNVPLSTSRVAPTSDPGPPTSAITPRGSASSPHVPQPQLAQNQDQPSPMQEPPQPRPTKRSRLSLQVPERVGGEVRLATPPLPEPIVTPVVMVNGRATEAQTEPAAAEGRAMHAQMPDSFAGVHLALPELVPGQPQVCFQDPTDRTNMQSVETIFMNRILTADWFDAKGNRIPPCSVDEAWAFGQRVIENLLKSAANKEAFLINLAALIGGDVLMHKGSMRITRLEDLPDRTRYSAAWELRFGDLIGHWTMDETVMHHRQKPKEMGKPDDDDSAAAAPNGTGAPQAAFWERRYKELAATLREREEEMLRLRAKVIESIRDCEASP